MFKTAPAPDELSVEQTCKELRRPLKHTFDAGVHLSSALADAHRALSEHIDEMSAAAADAIGAALFTMSSANDELLRSVLAHRDVFDDFMQ